jgi:U3 small nucleolar RNA-associated protein 25
MIHLFVQLALVFCLFVHTFLMCLCASQMGIQLNPGHGKGSGPNKGVYMRLFSDFYISDIVLASPIGLKLVMESSSKVNQDFLSSIEQIILHQADVLAMQNWEHVEFILRHTNQLPKEHHDDTDYSRVRPYFLDGKGCEHRQLILSTHFNTPELQSFFRQNALSHAGQFRLKRNWDGEFISNVVVPVKQTFQLIPSILNAESEEDMRFQYFKQNVLAQVMRLKQERTLIYAPSYLQYVKIRNELIRQEANAVFVCEYSRDSEISRGRSRFFQGLKQIMLYSGRAHFFR